MPLTVSTFILALWVFLVSTANYLAWYTVDAKLIGLVGVVFVIVLILEAVGVIGWRYNRHPQA